mmetsp:Transcript_30632/g.62541  ORF Transcript_30632/g.62541 Transcript_30632/m.62541 type:complete len:217 (-) Transcript_30632:123-773(-)
MMPVLTKLGCSNPSMLSFQSAAPISSGLHLALGALCLCPLSLGLGSSSLLIMDRDTLPPAASTDRTRTCTLSPTETWELTSSARPTVKAEMCTRPSISPSTPSASWDASKRTKAPKSRVETTLPSTNCSSLNPFSAREARAAIWAWRSPPDLWGRSLRRPPPEARSAAWASASSERMVTAICPLSTSTETMRTSTRSPALTTSSTLETKSSERRET